MKAIVSLRKVCRTFQSEGDKPVEVLKGIDLDIIPGTFNVIRGESGSGKTTLLRILGLLDSGFAGEYRIDGVSVGHQADWWLDEVRSDNIGFIFQDGQLFDHMRVSQNIELPLNIHNSAALNGCSSREYIEERSSEFFNREKEDVLDKYPRQVSGGQKQRAAVMRSIMHSPVLILADEPTASLDGPRKKDVLSRLVALCRSGHTVIVVSHDEIFRKVGRQLVMEGGKLIDEGCADTNPVADDPHFDGIRLPPDGREIFNGWKPRARLPLLLRQAWHETFQRPIFMLLVVIALVAGVTQISVFSSVITGANEIVDKAFTEGSRLNRVEIRPKRADLQKDNRFPIRTELASWENVGAVISRRQTLVQMSNKREEDITYVAMGLHDDDPEYKLLDFLGGGPFSPGVNQLEVIVTSGLLQDFFDTDGLASGSKTYGDYIGRELTLKVPRFGPDGKVYKRIPVRLRIIGIILNAEGGRQLYLPNRTQAVFDRVVADKRGELELPVGEEGKAWSVPTTQIDLLANYPWEDKIQVYTTGVREVIPVIKRLADNGYKPESDIWKFKWALDIQDIAWRIFRPLLILIILAVSLTVAANIWTSAKMREKEFALWRVLGMRRGDLAVLQVLATIMAILIGMAVGLFLAWLVVEQSRNYLIEQYPDQGFSQIFAPVAQFFLPILGGAMLVGITAALWPAVHAAKVDPAKVLQS